MKNDAWMVGKFCTCFPNMLPIKASGTATLIVVFAERTSTIPEPVVSLSDLSCKVRQGVAENE